MGDYLNHVAARVSGLPAAVRPRLPSLFEPPKPLASTRLSSVFNARRDGEGFHSVTEEVDAAVPAASSASAATAPRVHRVRPAPPPPQPTEAIDDRVSLHEPSAAPTPRPVTRRVAESSAPQAHQEFSEPSHAHTITPVVIPRPAGHEDRPAAPRHRNASIETSEVRALGQAAPPHSLSPRFDSAPSEPPLVREVHAIDRLAPAPAQPGRAAPVVPAPVQYASAPKPAPPVFFNEAVENAAPSVQVVIGRVTVQAVTPPPHVAPAPPRPRAPRLSLEDYLKQREARA
jgi:hypothetical protein